MPPFIFSPEESVLRGEKLPLVSLTVQLSEQSRETTEEPHERPPGPQTTTKNPDYHVDPK